MIPLEEASIPYTPIPSLNASPDAPTSAYVPVGPLRLADTRRVDCGCERVDADTISVAVTGRDGVPDEAVAASITVTAIAGAREGFVTAYPGGTARPVTSTVNTRVDRVVANSTILPIGDDGAIELYSLFATELVVDITGAFVPAERSRGGRYQAVTPRRIIDIQLHDVKVRHSGTHRSGDQSGQRAVAVVWREFGVVGVGQVCQLLAHGDPVPGEVGHDDIRGVSLEERFVLMRSEQAFAVADRRGRSRSRQASDHTSRCGRELR